MYRTTDPETSKLAAESVDASSQRLAVIKGLKTLNRPVTPRELSEFIDMSYHAVQRRISEIANIRRGDKVKDYLTGRWTTLLEVI